jgi:hypothetical protein
MLLLFNVSLGQEEIVKGTSMHSHLCSHVVGLKKLLIQSVNGVFCYSHSVLFYKGMLECLEEILTQPKWKLELEWNTFFPRHSKKFRLQFGLV